MLDFHVIQNFSHGLVDKDVMWTCPKKVKDQVVGVRFDGKKLPGRTKAKFLINMITRQREKHPHICIAMQGQRACIDIKEWYCI